MRESRLPRASLAVEVGGRRGEVGVLVLGELALLVREEERGEGVR